MIGFGLLKILLICFLLMLPCRSEAQEVTASSTPVGSDQDSVDTSEEGMETQRTDESGDDEGATIGEVVSGEEMEGEASEPADAALTHSSESNSGEDLIDDSDGDDVTSGAVPEMDDEEVVSEVKDETADRHSGTLFIATNVPRTDRIVNVLTAQTVRPGSMVLTVDHRANTSFTSPRAAWFDFLGLDAGGVKIGIGLRYGILDFLDAGFYRLSNGTDLFDVYEFDTRINFLRQEYHVINAALRMGFTWFSQPDAKDASGFHSQLNVDRRLFDGLLLGAAIAVHTDSSNDAKTRDDKKPSAALLGYVEWRPVRRLALMGEIAGNFAGYGADYPIFAMSMRFLTYRHSFALVVANSQYMSADGLVANAWRGFRDLVFGFQIVREFNLIR